MITSEEALGVAHRIGSRIVRSAQWSGRVCTWLVRTVDHTTRGVNRPALGPAAGLVYQGTAGIALFLTELFEQTRDDSLLTAATGAINMSLVDVNALAPQRCGFYSGRTGIAYACMRLGHVTGAERMLVAARKIVAPLAGHEHEDSGIDVISGSAGSIPALLQMSSLLGDEWIRDVAIKQGEHLLRCARRGVHGWSWAPMPAWARDLTGLAHGSAGIAHALLELYVATGDVRFRYAAEQGFAYERHAYDRAIENWTDFRHTALNELLRHGLPEARMQMLRTGAFPRYERSFMSAWCHGAPGIGLTRLNAYARLGKEIYRREAEAAVRTTQRSMESDDLNASLCHGMCGNAETLLLASRILGNREARHTAESFATRSRAQHHIDGVPWQSGVMGGAPDPSLMLGESGVGYFYLRLAHPETPSVLLMLSPSGAEKVPEHGNEWSLRASYHMAYFGRTLRALGFRESVASALLEESLAEGTSELTALQSVLSARIASEPDLDLQRRVRDCFALEITRYAMELNAPFRCDQLIEAQYKRPLELIDWAATRAFRASDIRLVHTDWDCEPRSGDIPIKAPLTFVVYCSDSRAHLQPISAFSAAILLHLEDALTLDELVDRIRFDAGDTEVANRGRWLLLVKAQLVEAYSAGFITIVDDANTGARVHS